MADKKDTIGGLNDAVDTLNKDNAQAGIESNQILGNIESGIQDLYSVNSQMLEAISAIQQSMAPDAFGAAQATENNREEGGTPIVGGPAEASTVTPAEGKKGMGMLGMLGVAAAGAAAGLVAAFAGFLDFDAQKVKDKVLILTSIADEVDATDTAETVATLTSLGVGLAAFGVGSVANGIGQTFMDDNWAVSIKNNVATLVSIGDLNFAKALEAAGTLTIIGTGLAAFGLMSGVGALGQGLANSMNEEGWAQTIKDNVTTLVSIGDLDFFKALEAAASLTTMGVALAAFGIGSGIASFAKPDFATSIKDNVVTLASITSDISQEKAEQFSETMGSLAAGLLKFSGGNFLSSIMDAGAKLVNFLTGGESPIEQMMTIADKSEQLNKGADSLERIQGALSGLSAIKFDGADLGLEEMAEDLMRAVPIIESAIMGGTIKGGIFPWSADDVDFKGLASSDIKFDEAMLNIEGLRDALGVSSAGAPVATITGSSSSNMTALPVSANVSPTSTSSEEYEPVDPGKLTLPYDKLEKLRRAKQLKRAMGISAKIGPGTSFEGGVPTAINGQDVPIGLFTDEEIKIINGSRTMAADMNRTEPDLIPVRQSGQELQTAQAEANANSTNGEGTSMVQVNNSAPTSVNNNSNTQVAMRNQHHKNENVELLFQAV
jgi:hypothetical protein